MNELCVRINSAGYGGLQVLDSVKFSVGQGEIACIVGPNGCGKSTVLKAMVGLVDDSDSEILLGGQPLGRNPQKALTDGVSLLPQHYAVLVDLTVEDNLTLGGHLLGRIELRQRKRVILELFPELQDLLARRAGLLSGGESRLLGVARCLMPKPSVLLLDEPSIGLDPARLKAVFDRFAEINNQLDVSIVLAEQRLDEALKLSDKVIALRRGRQIFAGTPQNFLSLGIQEKIWHA